MPYDCIPVLRALIIVLVIAYVLMAVVAGHYPQDIETPRSYGYIWNLDANVQTQAELDKTHGYHVDEPEWFHEYGPEPEMVNGQYKEVWEWRWIKVVPN